MKNLTFLIILLILVSACGVNNPTSVDQLVQTAIAETALANPAASSTPAATAPPPATATTEPPTATSTQIPTETATPTDTSTPTTTSSPTPVPVTIAQLVALLQKNDFDCSPFKSINDYVDLRPGTEGHSCYKDNVYETIKYYDDGYVRLEVLNDPKSRVEKIEKQFKLLDELFPADFMAQLREASAAYDETAPRSVSGDAVNVWPPAPEDWWESLEAQYNVSSTTIGTDTVTFSLWFWQIECQENYICWIPTFPGEVFMGQNSLVWYNIELWLAP